MIFLEKYISQFVAEGSAEKVELAAELTKTRLTYDVHASGDPTKAFPEFVDRYNWLGQKENKLKYSISENLARNLPGAMFQDFLLHLVISLCGSFPSLDVFTEVKVPFGKYPIWRAGVVTWAQPSELSDIAVGYRMKDGVPIKGAGVWPQKPFYSLPKGESVLPISTVNSKIRVSQSEFFDWHGREQLMTKGNPNCFSAQVVLRKEMDLNIVEAAQAGEKFFLLGSGDERNVKPNILELVRFNTSFVEHLTDKMLLTHP